MADKWMDDRDREMRDRDWRRSEQYGRGDYRGRDDAGRSVEGRSFDDSRFEAQRSGPGRDRVFGERETGANYTRGTGGGVTSGGSQGTSGGYGGGGSPSGGQGQRFGGQDYTQGGRFYGDDRREPIYREEYGQGGVEYGDVPRGYDASGGGGGYQGGGYRDAGRDRYQGDYDRGYQNRTGPAHGGYAAGGTGGYDYERGYGDAGRGAGGRDRERFEDRAYRAGQDTGDFFQKAGEKITNWFKGDHLMAGSRDGAYGGQPGVFEDRGHRGRGPKNYARSDERINEEVHERLTDDSWLDASNIDVAVSDGEVTLSGTVADRQAKHRAERLVEDLSGVKHVQNNLRIAESNPLTSPGRGFGDSLIDQQTRSYDASRNAGDRGASGLSGITSTGAEAERSTGMTDDKKKN
jgi:hypothetical protein